MGESSNRQLLAEELKLLQNNDKKDEDDDQKFIKKDSVEEKTESEEKTEVGEIIENLKHIKNLIKPVNNQQRNLDREVGGLEEEEQKESSEKDVWDDRSEEVDKMGSTDTFNTTGMKSVVWKQKKDRLDKKRAAKHHHAAAGAALEMKGKIQKAPESQSNFDNMGYVDRLKHLKLDRSDQNKGGRQM